MILAAVSTGGEVVLKGVKAPIICNLLQKVENNACKIQVYNDRIYIRARERAKGFGKVVTSPYPGFPTDLQPQLAACAASCDGTTEITETVFDSRFKYVEQLKKFGANAEVRSDTVKIIGKKLVGADVFAEDLRGGMALCIAAMSAEGKSRIRNASHIKRGYQDLAEKISALGAKIKETND